MQALSLEQLERERDAFDAAALAAPDIDGFCSSTDWIVPLQTTWGDGFELELRRGDTGYVAFARYDSDTHSIWMGCDVMWGFACPLVGPDPRALVEEFGAWCRTDPTWQAMLISGVKRPSLLYTYLVAQLAPHFTVRGGPSVRRWLASLDGGLDGYLGRRSPKTRENLRRAQRRVAEEAITFERFDDDVDRSMRRMIAIEKQSWKGSIDSGLVSPDMREFYRRIGIRMSGRGDLRGLFAQQDGCDIGYIFGGVRAGAYRGFQFSFDERFEFASLGNVLQIEQIARLADEGVTSYDLGMDMGYKRRWADAPFDTTTLAIVRSHGTSHGTTSPVTFA